VDVDGIKRRAVQLTRGEEPAGSFFVSAGGKLVYFTSADDKGRGLFSITIDGKDRKRVSDGLFANLTPTKDRKKVFYAQDGEVYQMDLAGEKKKTRVEFALAVGVRQRSDADGVPSTRPRAHRRQHDVGGGDRDGELRPDQRRQHPHTRVARRDVRPDEAEQLRH
jgi:hypothetical protein